jgi:hypothetical protein
VCTPTAAVADAGGTVGITATDREQSIMKKLTGVIVLMGGIVATVGLTNRYTERQVEQAVRQNFAAAGLLAKMQVQAERMRRYEKEMFIYAAQPDKQAKYAKEFDEAHAQLLRLQNETAALSHKGFSDEDRAAMAKWIDATTFYTTEFGRMVQAAKTAQQSAMTGEQRAELTLKLNADIAAGKDRFRELLDGTAKMREAKEAASLAIGSEIGAALRKVWLGLAAVAAAAVLFAALSMRRGAAGHNGPSVDARASGLRPTHAR